MLGKSSYTNWDEGIHKMLYTGGKKLSDLTTDHNIFTFKGSSSTVNDEHLYFAKTTDFDDDDDDLVESNTENQSATIETRMIENNNVQSEQNDGNVKTSKQKKNGNK